VGEELPRHDPDERREDGGRGGRLARPRARVVQTARVLTLYQAEWCPFSSAVREVLTEHGLDFVAKQVEPWPEDREELKRVADGHDGIPTLVDGDGGVHPGTRAILRYLESLPAWEHAADHRLRFRDHLEARQSDAAGQLLESATQVAPDGGEPRVVDNADAGRYELWLGDTLVGIAAYRLRDGELVVTHTEVDRSCEGRGYGSTLVAALLEDAGSRGLTVRPLCPFVAAYIRRHPELQQLVTPGYGR
jgi:predicted GNAT family acetyltransferase/glutaredoxin